MLATFALVFVAFAWYYATAEHRKALGLSCLFQIVLASFWLRILGHWLIYPLILGVIGELIVSTFKKPAHRKTVLVGVALVVFLEYFSEHFLKSNVFIKLMWWMQCCLKQKEKCWELRNKKPVGSPCCSARTRADPATFPIRAFSCLGS
ncbi:MAG: hypothetical protein KGZ53_04380 [Peptococcaceae bacterium]|nr:hypothetical protein [Peptococcaceae bacterium]